MRLGRRGTHKFIIYLDCADIWHHADQNRDKGRASNRVFLHALVGGDCVSSTSSAILAE